MQIYKNKLERTLWTTEVTQSNVPVMSNYLSLFPGKNIQCLQARLDPRVEHLESYYPTVHLGSGIIVVYLGVELLIFKLYLALIRVLSKFNKTKLSFIEL
jgi:hypothetical protein